MGVLTEVYVDPALLSGGSGTIGSPYGDLQAALNTATRDATNGNRFNIKAGTAEVLTAGLSLSTYGTPDTSAPLVFQGYTAVAGDGGIGDLNGNNGGFAISTYLSNTHYVDLILRNTGGAGVMLVNLNTWLVNCNIHTSSAGNIVQFDGFRSGLNNCYVHDGGRVADFGGINHVLNSYVTTTTSLAVLYMVGGRSFIHGNIIVLGSDIDAIYLGANGQIAQHNSILQSGGTKKGINVDADSCALFNNLIEGYSGPGGQGIGGSTNVVAAGNGIYNCTTAYANDLSVNLDNETLGATPFAKSGSNTFANRKNYFDPVDTGNVWGKVASGAYPVGSGRDKGAFQHIAAGGSSGGRPEFRGSNL